MWFKIEIPAEYKNYMIKKGFVAVDGTSLTVCDVQNMVEPYWFTFMLVPHTQNHVIIPSKSVGEYVNIEIDFIAKMIQTQFENMSSQTIKTLQIDNEKLSVELAKMKDQILKIEQSVQSIKT